MACYNPLYTVFQGRLALRVLDSPVECACFIFARGVNVKVTKEDLENREVALSIEVEDGDLETSKDKAYRHLVQRINVPGFRKGKAPRAVVERIVGDDVMFNEVMEFFIPDAVSKAVEQEDIEQGGAPCGHRPQDVEIVQQDPSIIVKATVPLVPKITLDAYREIRIPKEIPQTNDEEVDRVLKDLQYAHAPWGPVDRPIEYGDQVTIDAHGEINGKEVTNQQNVVYYVSENSPIPITGFSEALVGGETDQETDFTVNVPDDYHDPELAGQECKFSVKIHEIKAKLLADLDDDFAKEIGDGYDGLDALKAKVREDLITRQEIELNRKHEESVVEALIGRTSVELSPKLVDHEAGHILEDEERTLRQQRVNVEQYLAIVGKSVDEHREDVRQAAVDRITRTQALNKIAELEGVQAASEEIDEEIEKLLQGLDDKTARRNRRELNTSATRESLGTVIVRRKALVRLVSIAKGEDPAPGEQTTTTKVSLEESNVRETENAASPE
ncbi:MAG: trigger factor [Chloroflexota bacterium]|nr:trigger factor [Chloroflexota bacterium]